MPGAAIVFFMSKFRVEMLILRASLTAMSLLIVLVLFEYYLRREVTYVVQGEVAKSGGFVEANPEFLVQQTARGRRFVPNAHVVIKNHFLSKQDVRMDINSLGFRGAELAEKQPNEFRILFLGDSITVADYLPEDQSFVSVVGKELNNSLPGRKVTVINSGIGNIGLEEEVNILEDTVAAVKPDLVVVDFYLNDSRPPWGFSGEIGDRGWLRRHSLIADTIYRQLEERRWVEKQGVDRFAWVEPAERSDWKNDPKALTELAALAKYDWGAGWDESSWTKVEAEFQRLQKIASQARAKVWVVALPVRFQVEAKYLADAPQRSLETLTKKFGFAFYDLLPELRKHQDETLYFDHCHPDTRGNALIGQILSRELLAALKPPEN